MELGREAMITYKCDACGNTVIRPVIVTMFDIDAKVKTQFELCRACADRIQQLVEGDDHK